jgi:hypothetical protein
MASFDVIVKLVDQTKGSMKNIESGLKGIQSAASRAQTVLAAMVSGQVVKQLYETGTAIEAIEKRLKFITPAGTDAKALFKDLSGLASSLGADVYDMSNAFVTLRNNGLAPTEARLTAITNIAKVSGASINDVADALGNVGDAEKLKALERATGDLIKIDEVLNAYGQSTGKFAIKYAGQTVQIVSSSKEAVQAIENIGNTQLKGAAQESAKSLGGAFGELKNKIIEATAALLDGGLRDALIDIAEKATKAIDANKDFIKSFGADLGRAVTIGADALKLLADNFGLIKDAVVTLLIVRLGSALLNLSSAITNNRGPIAAFIRSLFGIGTAAAAASGGIAAVSTAAAVGPITAFATRMGVLFATLGGFPGILTAIGAGIVALVTSPIALLTGALVAIEFGFQKAFNISPIDTMAAGLEKLVTNNFPRVAKFLNDIGNSLGMAPPPSVVNAPKPITGGGDGKRMDGTQDPRVLGQPGSISSQVINSAAGADTAPNKPLSTVLDALGELNKKIFDANNAIRVLEPALAKALASGDVVRYNQVWEALKGNYETIGRDVLPNLGMAAKQASKELVASLNAQEQELAIATELYKDVLTVVREFAVELDKEALSLDKRGSALTQSNILNKIFNNEVQAANNALTENAARLDSVSTQQALFKINIEQSRISLDTQKQTLGFLSAAFAAGKITLAEYTKELGNLDAALLNSDQVLSQALGTAQRDVDIAATRLTALEKLNAEFRAGTVAAKAYRVAAGNLGGDTEEIERTIGVYGTFKDRLIENNEFIKKSIKGAATTFSQDFTKAFMEARNPLEAFKDFFGNILSDIANRMIKQQLADPLAEALTGIANELIGAKGDGKMGKIMTEGMGATGDTMVDYMKSAGSKMMDSMSGAASGITDIFSGMGDSLGNIFNSVFSWIKDGIGSIGSSMGGLGGMFGSGGGSSMFGDIVGSIGSFLGFADGGRPPVGEVSLVGERGPELFVPDTGGTVIPNDQMGGSNDALVVNFNLNAIDTMTGTQFLLQNKPAIVNMIGEAYNKRGRRGPLD